MHVAFTRGVLSIPQVRIAQQAGRIEMQNTLDTILFDLPDLKSAIVRVATLHQISRAGEATAARRKIGRELQQIGIDALDQAYTGAKQSQGDMGADVELLRHMSGKILVILDPGVEIDRANRVKRDQAVQQLGEVRSRLMEGQRAFGDEQGQRAFGDEQGQRAFGDEQGQRAFGDEQGQRAFGDEQGQRAFGDDAR